MSATPILLAVPDLAQETDLVAHLTRPGSPLSVARRCVDAVDLLGAAAAGTASVAVVGAGLPRLTRDTVARMAAGHVRVIGVALMGDQVGARRLEALDIPVVAIPGDDMEAAVGALVAMADEPRASGWAYSRTDDGVSGLGAAPPGSAPGQLLAVWGPTGAPGRTTVAVALADEVARSGVPALLVDADTYGGAVATHLGLLDDVSGIVVACRQADAGALDPSGLAGAARTVDGHLRVLTGIPQPSRWPELRPAALTRLWDACREISGVTVVDTGFGLERDEEMLHDTRSPRRHAATLTALSSADAVVAVGAADPVSMERLVTGLEDLRRVVPQTPLRVVITRVRRSVLGRDPEGQVREALRRHAGIEEVTCIPDDPGAFDACLREGRTLAEVAPRCAARGILREFAAGSLMPQARSLAVPA